MLEESDHTLTWLEDDRTALRLIEVVILSRSGRSPRKSNFSRAELRLGNRTSRDLRDLGTCLGARVWYRDFGVASGVFAQSFDTKTRGNWQKYPEPSHPIYRRLEPRSTRGVLRYAGRTAQNVIAYVSEVLECECRHPSEYAGRTRVRGAYLGSDRWLLRIMLPNFDLNINTKWLINFGNS